MELICIMIITMSKWKSRGNKIYIYFANETDLTLLEQPRQRSVLRN